MKFRAQLTHSEDGMQIRRKGFRSGGEPETPEKSAMKAFRNAGKRLSPVETDGISDSFAVRSTVGARGEMDADAPAQV